jgi:TatD DNase family protein
MRRVSPLDVHEPPAPQPLPLPVVDNHTHLDHTRRGEEPVDVADAVAAATAVNVTRLVQIGCDPDSARWTVSMVEARPELVGGVSLHPTQATRISAAQGDTGLDAAFEEIEKLAAHPRIRVIGETGLDHFWVPADDERGRAAQERSFRAHIDLAKRTGKVLQIHDRDAHGDVLRVLAEEGAPDRTVFHCFSGDERMARFCAESGWYLSFAGTVTFANAGGLRSALRAVPVDRVLVETDAPYLAPHPHRGQRNGPHLLPLTVRVMAAELDLDEAELCRRLDVTSESLYGPW